MAGKAKDRVELVDTPIPLKEHLIGALSRRRRAAKRLFEPLGYVVTAEPRLLDENFPDWGQSRYYRLTLGANVPLRSLLTHL